MPQVVSKSVHRVRLAFVFAFVLLLLCVLFLASSNFYIRAVASRFQSLPSRDEINAEISRACAEAVRLCLSTQSVGIASASSPGPVASTPRLVLADLSTWEDGKRRPRAICNGVECGLGDYCEFGVVVSIRPSRVICRSDDGLVLVARRSSPPSVPLGAEGGEDAVRKDAPSW